MYDDMANDDKTVGEALSHNALTTGIGIGAGAGMTATIALFASNQ